MNEQQLAQLEQVRAMLEETLLPTLKHIGNPSPNLVRGEEVNTRFYTRQLIRSLDTLING